MEIRKIYWKLVDLLLGRKDWVRKISFEVENKSFEAYVPDDSLWGAVKDILLNREYEFLPNFELNYFKHSTIVDAGAHVGLSSLVASFFSKKVIAIEFTPPLRVNNPSYRINCKGLKKLKILSKMVTTLGCKDSELAIIFCYRK